MAQSRMLAYAGQYDTQISRKHGISMLTVVKWIIGIAVICVVFMFGSRAVKFVKNLMDSVFGADKTNNNEDDLKDGIVGNQFQSSVTGSALNTLTGKWDGMSGQTMTKAELQAKPWIPVVDSIWEKLSGDNAIYYPEIVNRLASMTDSQVKSAVYYWNDRYRKGEGGKSLQQFIEQEWHGTNYNPAIGKLKKVFPPKGGSGATKDILNSVGFNLK